MAVVSGSPWLASPSILPESSPLLTVATSTPINRIATIRLPSLSSQQLHSMALDGLFPRPATGAMPSQRLSKINGLAGWRNGWWLPFRWGMNTKVNMWKTQGSKDEWIITNWNDISTFPRVPLIPLFKTPSSVRSPAAAVIFNPVQPGSIASCWCLSRPSRRHK